jgi:hypothetical protein
LNNFHCWRIRSWMRAHVCTRLQHGNTQENSHWLPPT